MALFVVRRRGHDTTLVVEAAAAVTEPGSWCFAVPRTSRWHPCASRGTGLETVKRAAAAGSAGAREPVLTGRLTSIDSPGRPAGGSRRSDRSISARMRPSRSPAAAVRGKPWPGGRGGRRPALCGRPLLCARSGLRLRGSRCSIQARDCCANDGASGSWSCGKLAGTEMAVGRMRSRRHWTNGRRASCGGAGLDAARRSVQNPSGAACRGTAPTR